MRRLLPIVVAALMAACTNQVPPTSTGEGPPGAASTPSAPLVPRRPASAVAGGRLDGSCHPEGTIALEAMVPPGAQVGDAVRVEGGGGAPPLLATMWSAGSPEFVDDQDPPVRGVALWEIRRHLGTGGCRWRLSYEIRERYTTTTGLRTKLGPPGRTRTERVSGGSGAYGFSFDAGDATGDGTPDILVFQGGWGSGGCGIWRLLSRDGPSIRQSFRRETCDATMAIRQPGILMLKAAVFEPGDSHCCPSSFRRTLLRWTPSGWTPLTIQVDPVQP